jgi:hypothetical protein
MFCIRQINETKKRLKNVAGNWENEHKILFGKPQRIKPFCGPGYGCKMEVWAGFNQLKNKVYWQNLGTNIHNTGKMF